MTDEPSGFLFEPVNADLAVSVCVDGVMERWPADYEDYSAFNCRRLDKPELRPAHQEGYRLVMLLNGVWHAFKEPASPIS